MKRVIRLTESDLSRIVKRVIMEQQTAVKLRPMKGGSTSQMKNIKTGSECSKFKLISKEQYNSEVGNLSFKKGSDTDDAKELVKKSKKIYKFQGTTDEANKNLSCIGLTQYKSKNYDFYEPNLYSNVKSNYFYIGVW